jgi:hypothetical protein
MITEPVKFYKTVVALPTTLEPNTMYAVRVGEGFDFYLSDLTGSIAYKINMPAFSTLKVEGKTNIIATNNDTLEFKAGTGIRLDTNATTGSKSITVSATVTSGTSTTPIKTFNILNEFSAPLLGKSIFVPTAPDTIRTIQLTNGKRVGGDLMVGLYRNNDLLGFYTIPSGFITYTYSGLDFPINTNDYITVNVVAGMGENFSMGLFNFDT